MSDKKQPSILILDPSSLTCQMLMRKLQKLGCEVHVQSSSGLAADTALDTHPDVILLELSFEDPSGFEICQAIKGDYDLQKIPVVIHTSRSTRQNVLRSIRAGASSVIVKPAAADTDQPAGGDTRVEGAPQVEWPADRVTTMRKPVDGRALIAALSHMCQQNGTDTKTNADDQERAASSASDAAASSSEGSAAAASSSSR